MENLTFEEAMKKMEEIVHQLEQNDIPLEKSMELFQTGMELSKICNAKLAESSEKVQVLLEENGKIVTKSNVL